MTVRIDRYLFTSVRYDRKGDVLYLHIGEPAPAITTALTPENHLWRFDGNGDVIGLTMHGIRHAIEKHGELSVTLPRVRVRPEAVSPAMSAG